MKFELGSDVSAIYQYNSLIVWFFDLNYIKMSVFCLFLAICDAILVLNLEFNDL